MEEVLERLFFVSPLLPASFLCFDSWLSSTKEKGYARTDTLTRISTVRHPFSKVGLQLFLIIQILLLTF